LGILLCKTRAREFSKFARNKLLARTGCDTGITTTESTGGGRPIGDRARTGRDVARITLRLRDAGEYLSAQNGAGAAGLPYRPPFGLSRGKVTSTAALMPPVA